MNHNKAWQERFAAALMPNYGTPPLALSHGDGSWVQDVDGNDYLDFFGGIAVSSLGHNHPALVRAVCDQVSRIAHTSNLLLHEPEVVLAERLRELTASPGKVLFTNSGTEANEAALKLAISYGKPRGRDYFVAAQEGFHGRSLGALALTGKEAIREPFGPFGVEVKFVPFADAAAMREAVTSECAAVFLEPTQGENGVVPSPDGYLAEVRRICHDTGALLVVDEIQSGIGRGGEWFVYQAEGVTPDVLTLAKGLGGGLPIGACVGFGEYGDVLGKGTHGSTFGGNPVAAAAANAVLDTIADQGLLAHVAKMGQRLREGITAAGHGLVSRVRGRGLWLGVVLRGEVATDVETQMRARGILVNAVRPNVVRLAPPLVVTSEEIDRFLAVLPGALDAADPGGEPA